MINTHILAILAGAANAGDLHCISSRIRQTCNGPGPMDELSSAVSAREMAQ